MLQKRFKKKNFTSLIDNFNVHYYPRFLSDHQANKYFNILEYQLFKNYETKSKIIINGKELEISRKIIGYGDKNICDSNNEYHIRSWENKDIISKILKNIRHMIEIFTGKKFNFVLINRYENGMQSIGFHRDKEKCLGNEPDIIGISLGADRLFRFKCENFLPEKIPKNFELILEHGSLLAIYHPTNKYWMHSVPISTKVKDIRISLTFRYLHINKINN